MASEIWVAVREFISNYHNGDVDIHIYIYIYICIHLHYFCIYILCATKTTGADGKLRRSGLAVVSQKREPGEGGRRTKATWIYP